jgi:hypothetical protein
MSICNALYAIECHTKESNGIHMKKNLLAIGSILILLCAGLLLWPRQKEKSYSGAIAKLSPAQVHVQIAKLEKVIIPTDGTPLQDVEAVYGKTSLNDPSEIKKGKREVLHWLHLLPFSSRDRVDFRAMLLMRVENNKTVESGINHFCVIKNRRQMPGPPYDAKTRQMVKSVQEQLQREERGVLEDLLHIRDRYSQELKTASWNHSKPQVAD